MLVIVTDRNYHFRAQSLTPPALMRMLSQLTKQTGFVGAIVLAGPDPLRGGDIKTMS